MLRLLWTLCGKKLYYVENSTILKLKTFPMCRMYQKTNNREHFDLTQNFSIYRINIISAGQL